MADTCMGQIEINHSALHLRPLHPQHPLRPLICELESLGQHNLSCKRKCASNEVTFSPFMSGDFKPRM